MKRIIGIPVSRKERVPDKKPSKPDLPKLLAKVDTRADNLDKKIEQCERELKKISQQLKTLPEGGLKNSIKSKAQGILQRKKKFEEQSEALKQQSFNMALTVGTIESAKDAGATVVAMKSGLKELKKAQKKVDVEEIEDLHDEMEQLFEKNEDIQEVFARNLSMPEVDDQELQEQFELLGDDLANDHDTSYIDDATSLHVGNRQNGQSNGIGIGLNASHSSNMFPPPNFNFSPSNPNPSGLAPLDLESPLIDLNSPLDTMTSSSK